MRTWWIQYSDHRNEDFPLALHKMPELMSNMCSLYEVVDKTELLNLTAKLKIATEALEYMSSSNQSSNKIKGEYEDEADKALARIKGE